MARGIPPRGRNKIMNTGEMLKDMTFKDLLDLKAMSLTYLIDQEITLQEYLAIEALLNEALKKCEEEL